MSTLKYPNFNERSFKENTKKKEVLLGEEAIIRPLSQGALTEYLVLKFYLKKKRKGELWIFDRKTRMRARDFFF